MDRRLNANNTLSYKGVNSTTPPNLILFPRQPTTKDYRYMLGDIWLDTSNKPPTNGDVYMLTDVQENIATWISFAVGPGDFSLTGDDHIVVNPDGANNINIVTDVGTITFSGNPGTHTITLNSHGGGTFLETLTGTDAVAVQPDAVGNIDFTTTTAGLTMTRDAAHIMSFDLTGGGIGVQTLTTDDANVVVPDGANNVNFFGIDGIATTGATPHTITVNAGDELANQYTTDAGIAVPVANNLNFLGGTSITTSGAGDTILISVDPDTGQSFVTDNGTAIPAGGILNVVHRVGSTIHTTGAGNTITIGTAAVPTIITNITTTGNWSKNPATQLVDIYLWCAGGGGSGGKNMANSITYGGNGGTQGAVYVMLKEPAATFAPTELITIGAGGAGGAGTGGNGGNGGISSVGSVIVPAAQTNGGIFGASLTGTNIINYIGNTSITVNGGVGCISGTIGASSDFRSFSWILDEALAPTGGGGGGGINSSALGDGGNGGSIRLSDGTVIVPGGAGQIRNTTTGPTNGSNGTIYQGFLTGGTGGGGSTVNGHGTATPGANGGIPGGGGGGGGAIGALFLPGNIGGNGAQGYIRIIEYL